MELHDNLCNEALLCSATHMCMYTQASWLIRTSIFWALPGTLLAHDINSCIIVHMMVHAAIVHIHVHVHMHALISVHGQWCSK